MLSLKEKVEQQRLEKMMLEKDNTPKFKIKIFR